MKIQKMFCLFVIVLQRENVYNWKRRWSLVIIMPIMIIIKIKIMLLINNDNNKEKVERVK